MYLHELRSLRSALFVWAAVMVLVSLLFSAMYPAFSQDVDTSRKFLESFPPAVRDMFGLSLSVFFTYLGFHAYTFTYMTLLGAIMAMNVGLGAMAREAQSKTTDFLLTKPVRRRRVFAAKLAAMLTIITVTFAVYCAATYLLALTVGGEFDGWRLMGLNAVFYGIQLWFMALGIFVSQLARKIRSVLTYTLGFVFGFFAIGLVGSLIGDEKVRYVTPFKYVDYLTFVAEGTIDMKYALIGSLFAIVMVAVGYARYVRRDMKAVA